MNNDEVLELTGEKNAHTPGAVSRRKFFGAAAAGAAGLALARTLGAQEKAADHKPPAQKPADIKTNIDSVRNIPRTKDSMPGRYPGRVVKIATPGASIEGKINAAKAAEAVNRGMAELTGETDMAKALAAVRLPVRHRRHQDQPDRPEPAFH